MELNLRGQAARRVLSLLAAVAVVMVWAIVVPHGSAHADPSTGSDDTVNIEPAFPNIPHGTVFGDGGVISINDKLGYGWCIDLGVPEPSKAPNKYTTPQKLTHVAPLMTAENGKLGPTTRSSRSPRSRWKVTARMLRCTSSRSSSSSTTPVCAPGASRTRLSVSTSRCRRS